jgi:soluble lytic murein transglycosylase-like protein
VQQQFLLSLITAIGVSAPAASMADTSTCTWEGVGARYRVNPHLLYAIATVESGLNAGAISPPNANRTYDIGMMQINSGHLPALSRYGISEQHLLDPCINMEVGAWILAQSFARHGLNWDAIGAYNASCSKLRGRECQHARSRYAWKIYRASLSQASK